MSYDAIAHDGSHMTGINSQCPDIEVGVHASPVLFDVSVSGCDPAWQTDVSPLLFDANNHTQGVECHASPALFDVSASGCDP
eukprot:12429731-Karenia_brevis.AAC.1